MKYHDLQIQTQRAVPNNARTEGFAFLVRAGYLTRENTLTPLGEYAILHLQKAVDQALLTIPGVGNDNETFFPIPSGDIDVAHCPNCKYTERLDFARFAKSVEASQDSPLPLEKIATPDCSTIEALAAFLNIPREKTAKALMFSRVSDGRFIFIVVRGDRQLSEAKLKAKLGEIRPATPEEIIRAGAIPGYASAIGLGGALIVVDDLIPRSPNLVAGANEAGLHLKNTNYGRDYSAAIVADLTQAKAGDGCIHCGNPLSILSTIKLNDDIRNILLALAETHHDDKGLTLPHPAAPFDVYLMNVPGRELDTCAKAEEIYLELQNAHIPVLFDDRDERAGVKFNDADLIGPPIRVTVGERGMKEGMVELKLRSGRENTWTPAGELVDEVKRLIP